MIVRRPSDVIRLEAAPLAANAAAYDPLLSMIGDARFVLLGEATHGTHEFYRARAVITQRLIAEKSFTAVAVEADWPDAYRVNRYVRGAESVPDAPSALEGFTRFPSWTWRNRDVLEFVRWLRGWNERAPQKAGFYGLDLYSLYRSIEAVLEYLDRVDPDAARRARERYACFEGFGAEEWRLELDRSCEEEAVRQMADLRQRLHDVVRRDGMDTEDEAFMALRNAALVKNAHEYYRASLSPGVDGWNVRDRHMADTLDALAQHLSRRGRPARIVVWAHNSHVGDARATEAAEAGELNLGQLARERHAGDAFLVGFTTNEGTVTAASAWGGPPQIKHLRPALHESHEETLHETDLARLLVDTRRPAVREALPAARLERAVGVVYRPETERASHYFFARLPEQFDAVIHFDETHAVQPL